MSKPLASSRSTVAALHHLRQEAVFWDWRLRGSELSESEWCRFEAWHAVAAHRDMLEAVAILREDRQVSREPPRPTAVRRLVPLARVALCAMVLLVWGPGIAPPHSSMPPSAAEAQPREIIETLASVGARQLSDGSVVRTAADTEVTVHMKLDQRLIYLSRGRAFFQVAHETDRPFVVRTPDAVIQARGTRFVVSTINRESVVTVVEGAVDVILASADELAAKPADTATLHLNTGDQTHVSPANEAVVSRAASDEATAWAITIRFAGLPVREALARFNEHNRGLVELILSPTARDVHITGTFLLDEPEAFALYVATQTAAPVDVHRPDLPSLAVKPQIAQMRG